MPSQVFVNNSPSDATNAGPSNQRLPALRNTPIPKVPLEKVERCKKVWFEDGDVIIWAQDQSGSMLYRVHRRVLGESGAEPFCTVVDCDYPNPETSSELFLDGVWVLKYAGQDPIDIMYVLEWMYERPSIAKRSRITLFALGVYLERSKVHFIPAMRRCALEYLWNMLPTSLNYHQRVPTLVEDCYSGSPDLLYKPHVLHTLILLATQHQLVTILPLLYYYIAQWPMEWIVHGVPARFMGYNHSSPHDRFPLPQVHMTIVLEGREKLIRMRQKKVFNFMEDFTMSGTTLDFPTQGCDGAKREETGETCFGWLMRVWFFMVRLGTIGRPAALVTLNVGQWRELQKNCCHACGSRVMRHMLEGQDDVWKDIPGVFGYHTWDFVVEQQREVEKNFEADIC